MGNAEGMYKYCIDNDYGSGVNQTWGIKHFRLIENSLMNNEEVLMTFIGLHNYISMSKHDNNFAYAITNKRIIMAQKKLIGENFQTVSLDNINDITFSSGITFGILTIDSIKEKFNVGLNKKSGKKVNGKVHEVLDSLKTISTDSNGIHKSPIDQIKELKDLLDIGAISDEEFNAKKEQLLSRV